MRVYFMKSFLICTISLLSVHYALHCAHNKSSMTPQQFLEWFNDNRIDHDEKEKLRRKIKKHGEQSPELLKKAKQNDIQALLKLAELSDNNKTPPAVPMYWYSTIAQLKNIDSKTKGKAEAQLQSLWEYAEIEYEKVQQEIDDKKPNPCGRIPRAIEAHVNRDRRIIQKK